MGKERVLTPAVRSKTWRKYLGFNMLLHQEFVFESVGVIAVKMLSGGQVVRLFANDIYNKV
jgi:hypothetical protein